MEHEAPYGTDVLTALRHAMRQPRPWEHVMSHPTNQEWSDVIGVREHRHPLEEELAPYPSEKELAYVIANTKGSTRTKEHTSELESHTYTSEAI